VVGTIHTAFTRRAPPLSVQGSDEFDGVVVGVGDERGTGIGRGDNVGVLDDRTVRPVGQADDGGLDRGRSSPSPSV
jgi:hypothetical protein